MATRLPSTEIRYAIGVDRGGTNIRVALVRSDGQIIKLLRQRVPFKIGASADEAMEPLIFLLTELLGSREASEVPLDGIGVAIGGQVNRDGVIIGIAGPRDLPWEPLPIRDLVKQGLGTSLPVIVDVDSKGAAWGEYLYGAGRDAKHMVCLTVGTGIGGGLVLDGKLFHGALGIAGHVGFISVDMHGHRCPSGVMGCVEDYASGTAIARAARHALRAGRRSALLELAGGNIEAVSSELVFEAARRGDTLAQEVVVNAAYALGIAIASLLHVLNPDVVVIGGGVAEQGDIFLDPVRRTVIEYSMPNFAQVPIKAAELGNLAGVVGAAALLWQ